MSPLESEYGAPGRNLSRHHPSSSSSVSPCWLSHIIARSPSPCAPASRTRMKIASVSSGDSVTGPAIHAWFPETTRQLIVPFQSWLSPVAGTRLDQAPCGRPSTKCALMPPRFGMASLYTKLPLTDCPARLGPADADGEVDALPDGEGEDRVEAVGVGESLGDGDSRVEVGDGLAGSVAAGPGDPPVRKGTA